MTEHSVAVIVGSLRKAAFSRKTANALVALAPPSLKTRFIEIGELALYNEELEASVPASWAAFRQAVREVQAVLFVTPEYNRSVPGVLKNALDVGSRPYGQSVGSGKPAGIVSTSPGVIGGFGANHHLRQSLVFLDMPAMQQPEAYVGGAHKLFDADGRLTNDDTRGFLTKFMEGFAAWVEKHTTTLA
jgi:chromate reductase